MALGGVIPLALVALFTLFFFKGFGSDFMRAANGGGQPASVSVPGTPFFFEVVQHTWVRAGTKWEEVDMDQATVLDYDYLKAEALPLSLLPVDDRSESPATRLRREREVGLGGNRERVDLAFGRPNE